MESNKNLFWNKAMFWGFIIALASMLTTTVYYSTDNMFSNSSSWVEMAIFLVGIVACTVIYRQTLGENDQFSYANALGLGVSTSFFASLILAVFTFVLFKFIDPDLIGEVLAQTEDKLLESGMSDDIIEQQLEMQSKFITPGFMLIMSIIRSVFTGFIISLITSIFLKKKAADGFNAAMSEIEDEE